MAAQDSWRSDERLREVDRAIARGYEQFPPEPADAFTRSLAERSVMCGALREAVGC